MQLEIERRRKFAEEHNTSKVDFGNQKNPFAGKVICWCCGKKYGRKIWNSTNEQLRRCVWQCTGKYTVKGEKGCENRHIDERDLQKAFINAFNVMIVNKDYFMEKWKKELHSENVLMRYKAKQFISIINGANPVIEFVNDMFFRITEKLAYLKVRKWL